MSQWSILLLAPFLSACAGNIAELAQAQMAAYDIELRAYSVCNAKAAGQFAHQPGDPLTLAIAAKGSCGPEAGVLVKAMIQTVGVESANRRMRGYERTTIEGNAALIAKLRAEPTENPGVALSPAINAAMQKAIKCSTTAALIFSRSSSEPAQTIGEAACQKCSMEWTALRSAVHQDAKERRFQLPQDILSQQTCVRMATGDVVADRANGLLR